MKTSLSSKGQIVIPAELRKQDALRSGEEFEIERVEAGQYLFKRVGNRRNQGLVQHLLSCPIKGELRRPPSELTDTIRGLE